MIDVFDEPASPTNKTGFLLWKLLFAKKIAMDFKVRTQSDEETVRETRKKWESKSSQESPCLSHCLQAQYICVQVMLQKFHYHIHQL